MKCLKITKLQRPSVVERECLHGMPRSWAIFSFISFIRATVIEKCHWYVVMFDGFANDYLHRSKLIYQNFISRKGARHPKRCIVKVEIDNMRKTKAELAATVADLYRFTDKAGDALPTHFNQCDRKNKEKRICKLQPRYKK